MNLFYYIYFYLVLFYPVIEAYSGLNVLLYMFVSFSIIITHQRKYKQDSKILKFANVSLVCLVFYVIIQTFFFDGNIVVLKATFRSLIVPLVNVYALSCLVASCKRENFIFDLITVSTIAAIISLFLYFIPSVAQIIRDISGATEQLNNDTRNRGYGIASSLFSGYPLIQACCAYICIVLGKHTYKYIQFLLIILSITLNARTSLFVLASMVIVHYLMFSSLKQILTMFVYTTLGIIIFIILGLHESFIDMFDFVLEAYFMILDQFLGTSYTNGAGHFTGLMDTFLIWPDDIKEWIFGNGSYMLTGSKKGSSDVGFIIQLNYGGLIYLLLIAYPILFIIKKMYKLKKWEQFICLVITVFILNWKGDMFLQTNFVFLALSIYLNTNLFVCHENNYNNNSCL